MTSPVQMLQLDGREVNEKIKKKGQIDGNRTECGYLWVVVICEVGSLRRDAVIVGSIDRRLLNANYPLHHPKTSPHPFTFHELKIGTCNVDIRNINSPRVVLNFTPFFPDLSFLNSFLDENRYRILCIAKGCFNYLNMYFIFTKRRMLYTLIIKKICTCIELRYTIFIIFY